MYYVIEEKIDLVQTQKIDLFPIHSSTIDLFFQYKLNNTAYKQNYRTRFLFMLLLIAPLLIPFFNIIFIIIYTVLFFIPLVILIIILLIPRRKEYKIFRLITERGSPDL